MTAWINQCNKYDRIGAAAGATIILFLDLGIEFVLFVQCVAYCYMGYIDYKIYQGTKEVAYGIKE